MDIGRKHDGEMPVLRDKTTVKKLLLTFLLALALISLFIIGDALLERNGLIYTTQGGQDILKYAAAGSYAVAHGISREQAYKILLDELCHDDPRISCVPANGY